jgi:hypothetical protein
MNPERGIFCTGLNLAASFNAPARLKIYDDRLVIRVFWRDYVFPRSSVLGLRVVRFLFWRMIHIRHSIRGYSRFVAFRPFDFSKVVEQLTNAGFPFDAKA